MDIDPLRYLTQGEVQENEDGKHYVSIGFNGNQVIEDVKVAYNVLHFINQVLLDTGEDPDYDGYEDIDSVLEILEDIESSYMDEKYNLIIKENYGKDVETDDNE